jgi:hypothetical protein
MQVLVIIAVCSAKPIGSINIVRWQNENFLKVKAGGAYSYHWCLKT